MLDLGLSRVVAAERHHPDPPSGMKVYTPKLLGALPADNT